MAVYLISLRRLEGIHARRSRQYKALPAGAREQPSTLHEAVAETRTWESVRAPAVPATKRIAESPGAAGPTEEWLRLPKSQIEALLSESGELGSKALLALIYRLSSVESQLAELRAQIRDAVAPAPTSERVHSGPQAMQDASKAELLEQVFRKNVALRSTD